MSSLLLVLIPADLGPACRAETPFAAQFCSGRGVHRRSGYGRIMQKLSLDALAREELQTARQAASGRSARTVFGGHEHVLRQTVIALLAGRVLGDHENPGEATVQVLRGRVRLRSGNDAWDGRQGDLLLVPAAVHGLEATEDAVVLLTVAEHR